MHVIRMSMTCQLCNPASEIRTTYIACQLSIGRGVIELGNEIDEAASLLIATTELLS